jgi:uncharacterized protein (DUF305 family)
MSTHHAQAVAMAMIVYPKATDPDVRVMAYDIALTQENQIGMMATWLTNWRLQPTGSQPKIAWLPDGAQAVTRRADARHGHRRGTATTSAGHRATVDILFCQLMIATTSAACT